MPYLEVARNYVQDGQSDEAIKILELYLQRIPEDNCDEIIDSLAYLYFHYKKDRQKAVKIYSRKLPREVADNPDTPEYQDMLKDFRHMVSQENPILKCGFKERRET